MRSYYAHLEQAKSQPVKSIQPKPVLRSSAIFPVIQTEQITTRILFLGYWILKRNIKEIACVVTLRSTDGNILARSNMTIADAKTYRIELKDQLHLAGYDPNEEFLGSIEVEFFSTQNFVFPFPALDVNYYGPNFSSIVHTAQRIYNDFDDLRNNSQTAVPESGFNIYASKDQEPFFAVINGPNLCENSQLKMEFFNKDGETLAHTLHLGNLKPYQTTFCFPARLCDLEGFLKGAVGTAKITFNISWAFPRLVAGNWNYRLPALNVTHTYYDCEKAASKSDYWFSQNTAMHPASLMVPVDISKDHFTNIYFYPIYSPSHFSIGVELYDQQGRLLGSKEAALEIKSPAADLKRIALNALCQELGIKEQILAVRLFAKEIEGSSLPSRIKIGLDLGSKEKQMPCNICVNLQPYNSAFDGKPSTFRWLPFLADQPNPSIWMMNTTPEIQYTKKSELHITFFREQDTQTLERHITLEPNGFIRLDLHDERLKNFFDGRPGWLTIQATNPYTSTYYFTESDSGVIGGDHGF